MDTSKFVKKIAAARTTAEVESQIENARAAHAAAVAPIAAKMQLLQAELAVAQAAFDALQNFAAAKLSQLNGAANDGENDGENSTEND